MRINIQTIPHNKQRYETLGDYFDKKGIAEIRVSNLKNNDMEFLIAIHEMFEQYACRKYGVKEKDITAFDKMFENERLQGKWTMEEPGNDPRAPYRRFHFQSENIERLAASYLDVDWSKYERRCIDVSGESRVRTVKGLHNVPRVD
jgi:hypothetical protein